MDNTLPYAVLSERTDRSVRNRIRPADNSKGSGAVWSVQLYLVRKYAFFNPL